MTVVAFLQLVPITLVLEGGQFLPALRLVEHTKTGAIEASPVMSADQVLVDVALAGVCYFVYSEASFVFLELIHPVTHAVTNALKRVVVIAASVVVFHTSLSAQVIVGATLAVTGTLVYSLTQHYYK